MRLTKYSLRTTKDSTTSVLPAGLMGLVVALAGHGSERARNQKSSTHQEKPMKTGIGVSFSGGREQQ